MLSLYLARLKPAKDAAMAPRTTKRSGAPSVGDGRSRRRASPGDGDTATPPGERVAKVVARAGLGSRREIEAWIAEGRVSVNGKLIESPALNVTPRDEIKVDGRRLPAAEPTRLWMYHKPKGLVTTEWDPEGRPTVFESLPRGLPRVLSVGRLDMNTEGLLLLTNDGGLKRVLELPATGWMRRYRVRAHGEVTVEQLIAIEDGVEVDGIAYGPVEARIDRRQGTNVWLTIGIREGKNREVKNILAHLGLDVNRLIRLSYGPFQLLDLPEGEVREVPPRILEDQLGPRLADAAGADIEKPAPPKSRKPKPAAADPARRATAKAEHFARLQAGETATELDETMEDDSPDVDIDPETGKITLKEKTVSDRKGRKVTVAKKPRAGDDRPRRSRPRVFEEDGSEASFPAREAPRRDEAEERPRPPKRRDDQPRPSTWRADRRPAPRDRDDDRRDDRGEHGDRGDRPRSFGFRDRGPARSGEGGEDRPRRSYGFKDRGGEGGGERRSTWRPREDRVEGAGAGDGERPRRPYRPREDRADGDRPQRSFRPREDRGGGGEGDRPRRPWRPREDRPEGGGGDRPQRSFRPREDRGGGEGDRPRRPYRPREDRPEGGGGDRPQRSFRPREDRGGGEGDRPRRPSRPREDRADGDRPQRSFRPREDRGGGGGDGERPRRPWRPREDRPEGGGGDRPQRSFRPREDRGGGGGDGDRPRRPYRPREDRAEGGGDRPQRSFRPREDRGGGGGEGDRPRRPWRPREDRPEGGGGDRPQRSFRPREDRGGGGGFGDRPPRRDGPPRGGPKGPPRGPRRPRGE
jgi:23S rRNA pseudouridine2605 synthase